MKRSRIIIAVVLVVLALGGLGARFAYWSAVIAPGLASDDASEYMSACFSAARFGYRAPDRLPVDGAFLSSDVDISAPAPMQLYGEHDSEVQFVVKYTTPWRSDTGEAPGARQRFVYLGRDSGGPWAVIGGGTGP